jgi:hypothetical protein
MIRISSIQDTQGNVLRPSVCVYVCGYIALSITEEAELATVELGVTRGFKLRSLHHDITDIIGVFWVISSVNNDLCHRNLSLQRLVPCLKINCQGKAN